MSTNVMSFEDVAAWSSIISLIVSIVSLLLIGSLRARVVEMRRKARLRIIIADVKRMPDDAVPLAEVTKSKLASLSRNLPKGWLFWLSKRSKAAWETQNAIKKTNIAAIKEGIEDWVSFSEDL